MRHRVLDLGLDFMKNRRTSLESFAKMWTIYMSTNVEGIRRCFRKFEAYIFHVMDVSFLRGEFF
jgi:hypothetical protein